MGITNLYIRTCILVLIRDSPQSIGTKLLLYDMLGFHSAFLVLAGSVMWHIRMAMPHCPKPTLRQSLSAADIHEME